MQKNSLQEANVAEYRVYTVSYKHVVQKRGVVMKQRNRREQALPPFTL